jgi:hypothetical protein
MKINFPPRNLFLCYCLLSSFIGFSQESKHVVTNEIIGDINCSYLKSEYGHGNHVQLLIKNQQFLYKQEQDTIFILNSTDQNWLIGDLKEAVVAIDNEKASFKVIRANYIISKENTPMNSKVITIYNKEMSISTNLNKYFSNQLIEWLTPLVLSAP